jgi:hypothetical protein
MVATMACLQEAQRIGGHAAGRLIAAMTAAFTASGPIAEAIARRAAVAAGLLVLAAAVVLRAR